MPTLHPGGPRAVLLMATALAACMTAGTAGAKEPAILVLTDQNREDAPLVQQEGYRFLAGAGPEEPRGSVPWQQRAIANALLTDYYRNRESALYRTQADDRQDRGYPCQCLALSGGGMRSLAFGAGVLSALHRNGVYQQTDVMSAVSGGSYASYWILSNVHSGATEEEILSGQDSEQLTRLRAHANGLVSAGAKARMAVGLLASGGPGDPGEIDTGDFKLDVALSLIEIFVDAPEIISTSQNNDYGTAIHKMVTDTSALAALTRNFSKYRSFVESGSVPLPVWLTTARLADLPTCVGTEPAMELEERGRDLRAVAYEVSPFRIGSDRLGYRSPRDLSVLEALAASGAATNIPITDRCKLFSIIDSSVWMKNFRAPQYATDTPGARRHNGPSIPDFLLIDGGLADNLAVFPLVRRLCSEIIIVDAEFDPHLVFPSYWYLKQHLARQRIDFVVPELEALASRNRLPFPDDPSGPGCHDGFCLVQPRPECVLLDQTADCVAPDQAPRSIFEGRIGPIPIATPIAGAVDGQRWSFDERTLKVRYVKLAMDANQIDSYPATVRERHAAHAERREIQEFACSASRDTDSCRFPQESTYDLDLRDGQFEAYWDLGRCTIERYWQDAESGSGVRCADSSWPAVRPVQESDP